MRRSILQRGSIVLLLVSRLIFGELAHAVPHEEPAQAAAAALAAGHEQPCPEHPKTHTGRPADHASMEHATVAGSGGDEDCCKGDACKCPCMHVSAAVISTPPASTRRIESRAFDTAIAVARDRISGLFRPPA